MENPSITGIAEVLVVLGAINWGLIGIADLDILQTLLATSPQLLQLVYILIGLAGLYWLWAEIAGGSMLGGGKKKRK